MFASPLLCFVFSEDGVWWGFLLTRLLLSWVVVIVAVVVISVFGEELLEHSIPLGRAGRASDIASAALFLASAGGAYTTGANIVVDGGVLAKL